MRIFYIPVFLLLYFFSVSTCYSSSTLNGDAVADLRIGMELPKIDKTRLVFRRWQRDENDVKYELLRIKVVGGEVDVEVYDKLVWRIWIQKSGLLTSDFIQVGSSANLVLRRNSTIVPEVGPGPSLVLIPSIPCGISYVTNFKFKDDSPENLSREKALKILGKARISKILLVGCGTPK